jgi:hypothetical protein
VKLPSGDRLRGDFTSSAQYWWKEAKLGIALIVAFIVVVIFFWAT